MRDAEMIARLLRADRQLLHPVKLRSAEMQADLAVIRGRAALVEVRTQLVNTVRSLAKNLGCRLPQCSTTSFARRMEALIPAALAPAVAPLLAVLKQVEESLRGAQQRVETLAERKYPETGLRMQVSGVSHLTALTYVLTLWDRERFQRSRTVGAYLGLKGYGQADHQGWQCRFAQIAGAKRASHGRPAGAGQRAAAFRAAADPEMGTHENSEEAGGDSGGAEAGRAITPVVGR